MKFKNYILSLVLIFTNFLVNAQELFSPAGTSVSTSTVVFEYAIGDIIVGSNNNSNFQITQGFSQPRMVIKTYVPDDNFEAYLETHDAGGNVVSVGDANSMGDGIANNDYVTTANISGITNLNVSYQNISDLTGIEDFTQLTDLDLNGNIFSSVVLTQSSLSILKIDGNQYLNYVDISQLNNLGYLIIGGAGGGLEAPITNLDISNNTSLYSLLINQTSISDILWYPSPLIGCFLLKKIKK